MEETLLERLSKAQGISVEEMRQQLTARIAAGLNNPDSECRAQWAKIPCAGYMPTPEEYLEYTVRRLFEEGFEDLLRRYEVD